MVGIEVVRGDDSRLSRSISVEEACVGQKPTKLLHVGLHDGRSTCLDKLYAICHLGQCICSKGHEQADAGRHEEGDHTTIGCTNGSKEGFHIWH